jgi:hypothetical protein
VGAGGSLMISGIGRPRRQRKFSDMGSWCVLFKAIVPASATVKTQSARRLSSPRQARTDPPRRRVMPRFGPRPGSIGRCGVESGPLASAVSVGTFEPMLALSRVASYSK